MMRKIVTVDFETYAIQNRPAYPPEPVGVSIIDGDGAPAYYAWGHPTGNNCSKREGVDALEELWRDPNTELLFHNAKFDIAVAHECLGLPIPHWSRIHDTMFLMFLADPHSPQLSLKPGAKRYLGMEPDEQEELNAWLWTHKDAILEEELKVNPEAKITKRNLGAYIAYAPGDLVGKYADGDTLRTRRLFDYLAPAIREEGMWPAYVRERRLLPMLLENERDGICVDLEALGRDLKLYRKAFAASEDVIRDMLDAPSLNIDADAEMAEALSRAGMVDDDKWTLTKTGKRSVAKDALTPEMFNDPLMASALGYRNRLATCLKMFMEPWYRQAVARGGVISCNWNQIRGATHGTRTGRPSTDNPNFLNISKDFENKGDGYTHPAELGLPPLPLVRRYIRADDGHVINHRDFSGQELRVFGDVEQGPLMRAYQQDPDLDPHEFVKNNILEMFDIGAERMTRGNVKIMNFQALYGGGVPAAAKKLKVSLTEAKQFKTFHDRALPGRVIVNEEIKRIVRAGDPIVTWGGRKYYVEEPKIVNGRMQTWEYKLINYYVQGSAADITKEVLVNWYEDSRRTSRFLLTVYDEINASSPIDAQEREMQLLREHMENIDLDVPMRSDGKFGPNWGELVKCL